jgi:hypothetical protein
MKVMRASLLARTGLLCRTGNPFTFWALERTLAEFGVTFFWSFHVKHPQPFDNHNEAAQRAVGRELPPLFWAFFRCVASTYRGIWLAFGPIRHLPRFSLFDTATATHRAAQLLGFRLRRDAQAPGLTEQPVPGILLSWDLFRHFV